MNKKLIAVLVSSVGFCGPAYAAQQSVTQIGTLTGKNQLELQKAAVNTKLGVIESNRQDHETRVAALEALVGDRPWVAQATAPGDTTLLWFDTDQVADAVVLKIHNGTAWVQQAIGTSGGGDNLGNATAADVAALFSGTGDYLKADGTTGTPSGSYTLPTATASVLGGIKVGSRLTINDGVLSADVQTTDISGKENSLGNPSTNGYVLSSTTSGVRSWVEMTGGGTGISHATSDGNYYASRNGGWASLSGLFAPTLGTDDNYVTDAEKVKLGNLSGTNTGDQDISGKANVSCFADASSFNACFALDWPTGGGTWGSITGTLSAQTDLQNALNAKANATGIAFVAAALSDLKYDPDTGTADDEYSLITNTGSVGDANDATVVPTLERAGALFQAKDANLPTWPSAVSATEVGYLDGVTSGIQAQINGKEAADATILKSAAIGSTVQGYDPDLATWSGVSSSANGRSLVSAADYAAMRGLLDLEAGTDFYAKSAIDTQAEVETIWSVNLTNTIASGTASMGTSAIANGACATAVTVSASGVATTDIINMGFNGTPVGVTGYNPTGTPLNIIAYPTANNVNFLVCNSTGASVTPGALTINWRVDR